MFTSRKPPPRTEKPSYILHRRIEPGARLAALIGGPIVGVYTHFDRQSKPCTKILCEGAIPCPGCASSRRLEWSGYLPLVDDYNAPFVVIVKEEQSAQIDSYQLHRRVIVSRERRPKAPIRVKLDPAYEYSISRPGLGPIALDLRDWLVNLWRIPGLQEWLAAHPPVEAKPKVASQPLPAPINNKEVKANLRKALKDLKESCQ
jgi:hypothetical protein